jgi:tRNA G18 (ribose-2'-O)-methylase SpoU
MDSTESPDLPNVNSFLQNLTKEEICEYYRSVATKDTVVCLNLNGDINVGMMMRSAALFGVENFVILGKRTYDRRTAVGIYNYLPHDKIRMTEGFHDEKLDENSVREFLTAAKEKYQVVFVEQNERSFPLPQLNERLREKPPMFVFGNEAVGIPKSILELPDSLVVEIPQFGVGRSFNVSCACSIVLYERNRTRTPP